MGWVLIQAATNNTVMAVISLALVDVLLDGAGAGIVIGLFVGAVVIPMVQAPDTMLRGVVFAIIGAAGMSIYQLIRIGQVTGAEMSSIVSSFSGPYTDRLGAMMLTGITWTLYTMLAGALIGLATQVPGKVIKGGAMGLILGSLVGAGLQVVLVELNLNINAIIFRIVIAAVTWGLITSVIGGED